MAIERILVNLDNFHDKPMFHQLIADLPQKKEGIDIDAIDPNSETDLVIYKEGLIFSNHPQVKAGKPEEEVQKKQMDIFHYCANELRMAPIPTMLIGLNLNCNINDSHYWMNYPEFMRTDYGGIDEIMGYKSENHLRGLIQRVDMEADSTIYLLLGSSGVGKSTFFEVMMNNGNDPLTKTTTRPLRPKEKTRETESVSRDEFDFAEKEIVAAHTYKGSYYGFRLSNIFAALKGKRNFFATTNDLDAAKQLKGIMPNRIKVVSVLPPYHLLGFGLEKRMTELLEPDGDFASFQEELEHVERTEQAIYDTETRLRQTYKNRRQAEGFAQEADFVLTGATLEENMDQLLRYVYGT